MVDNTDKRVVTVSVHYLYTQHTVEFNLRYSGNKCNISQVQRSHSKVETGKFGFKMSVTRTTDHSIQRAHKFGIELYCMFW